MTAESNAMPAANVLAGSGDSNDESGPLYCYRHPKSETYVRCGRCDQPICPKCAVQGPVGFRCRQCGLVKSAAVTDFSPQQLALGLVIPIGSGLVLGYLGGGFGFFSIFLGFFAGGFVAEAFVRSVGMKRGVVVRAMLYGGLVAGYAIGALVQVASFLGPIAGGEGFPVQVWLQTELPYILIGVGAVCAGAYSRVRWF